MVTVDPLTVHTPVEVDANTRPAEDGPAVAETVNVPPPTNWGCAGVEAKLVIAWLQRVVKVTSSP